MDGPLGAWFERTGVTRAEVPGLVVATLGAVVAVLVAIRLPVTAPGAVGDGGAAAAAGAAATVGAPVVTPAPTEPVPPVLVHVTGAVADPGLVELTGGGRVADAVVAAGGAVDDAALGAVNLARPLVDGEQVHVPTREEVATGVVAGAGSGGRGGTEPGRLPDGRLDLATATAAQLEELPGIGPVLAGRIVAHREEVGGFDEPAALREVAGIGEATWAELRDLVGVRGAP